MYIIKELLPAEKVFLYYVSSRYFKEIFKGPTETVNEKGEINKYRAAKHFLYNKYKKKGKNQKDSINGKIPEKVKSSDTNSEYLCFIWKK